MKKSIFLVSMIFFFLSACAKERNKTVTVVRDCSGTYLEFNEKDYHVCNPEKVSSFANGDVVTATFEKIDECNGSAKDAIVCELYHKNEGWIKVSKIN